MPAKCTHPHQTCSGSNSSYVKISCSSCGAVLYQNYLAQIDKDLFRRKFRALEERMAYGVKDEKDLAMELLEMLKANPEMHWQDHRSLVEILSSYVERKESEEAPKPEEVFIPGTCQPKCSHRRLREGHALGGSPSLAAGDASQIAYSRSGQPQCSHQRL